MIEYRKRRGKIKSKPYYPNTKVKDNMTMIKNLPIEERPREKLKKLGPEKLSNTELLTVLLGSGTKDQSVITIAERIITYDEGGIDYLAECTLEELSGIKGLGSAKSSVLVAAVELGKRIATKPKGNRVNVMCSQDLADIFMADMRYLKNECFKVLLLNTKNEVIAVRSVSMGIINSSVVDPREVFRPAIRRGAAAVVLAHNHPSGNPEPSSADIEVTVRLAEAGKLLGIKVLDHIVIGDGVFVSMRKSNLLG
jgi:DNA repair protein RadC